MINRIQTRLHQLYERAQFRRMLRHSPPTVRADLWAAADRYMGHRPAIGVDSVSQYPFARHI